MSTLDKSIRLLKSLPDDSVKTAYLFLLNLQHGSPSRAVLMDDGSLLQPNPETLAAMDEADLLALDDPDDGFDGSASDFTAMLLAQ